MDKWGVDDKHWNDVACAALTALTPRSGTMVATLNDVLRDAAGLAPDASSRCVSRRPREIKEALARHLLKLTRPQPGQQKGAEIPTFKAHISVVSHSFWLLFGRVIISRHGLEA